MSKGNMLLGYARGSVGDVVMSRVKGQQVAKARNRKPANPKTNKQMAQRASFIAPVKFFTHGVQALFKFAYSDKKVTESDFNAFQRNNAKASFPVTKAENESNAFPALGEYLMAKGKLPEIPTEKLEGVLNANFVNLGAREIPTTIAQLSAAFVAQGLADEGDIITIVAIDENVAFAGPNELVVGVGNAPKWTLNQFIVDSSNPATVATELPNIDFRQEDGTLLLETKHFADSEATHLHAVAYVRSKETALGLEVSTAYLKNGGYIDDYIAYRRQAAQVNKVLADWGATGEAILQGSIAKK